MQKISFFTLTNGSQIIIRAYNKGKAYTLIYAPYYTSGKFMRDQDGGLTPTTPDKFQKIRVKTYKGDDVYFDLMRQFNRQEFGFGG